MAKCGVLKGSNFDHDTYNVIADATHPDGSRECRGIPIGCQSFMRYRQTRHIIKHGDCPTVRTGRDFRRAPSPTAQAQPAIPAPAHRLIDKPTIDRRIESLLRKRPRQPPQRRHLTDSQGLGLLRPPP